MLYIIGLTMVVLALKIHFSIGTEYVDLSYAIGPDTPFWPDGSPYAREALHKGYIAQGVWYESYHFCMDEHTGTHLDAPSHFAKDKWTVNEIPLSHLMGPGVLIDIEDKVAKNPNAEVSTDDVMTWLDEHGPFPDGAIVFIRTGWSSRYDNKFNYYGTATSDISNLTFPGLSHAAAQFLASYESSSGHRIVGVGMEGPSMDPGPSTEFKSHEALFKANIYGLENLRNLTQLPAKGFDVVVMPLKLQGGSGGPVRIIAMIPGANNDTYTSSYLLGALVLGAAGIVFKICKAI